MIFVTIFMPQAAKLSIDFDFLFYSRCHGGSARNAITYINFGLMNETNVPANCYNNSLANCLYASCADSSDIENCSK